VTKDLINTPGLGLTLFLLVGYFDTAYKDMDVFRHILLSDPHRPQLMSSKLNLLLDRIYYRPESELT
jgi:hypothetical protein